MMNSCHSLRGILMLTTALLLAGCGSSSDNVLLPGPDSTTLFVSALTPDHLTATLAQDKSVVAVTTGTINYTMTLTNKTQSAVSVSVPLASDGSSLPPVSLSVKQSNGDAVYPGSAGSAPTGTGQTQTLTLQPGDFVQQSLQLSNAFQVISRYQATAIFTTPGAPITVGPLILTAR